VVTGYSSFHCSLLRSSPYNKLLRIVKVKQHERIVLLEASIRSIHFVPVAAAANRLACALCIAELLGYLVFKTTTGAGARYRYLCYYSLYHYITNMKGIRAVPVLPVRRRYDNDY
jgi:hypothetical protein